MYLIAVCDDDEIELNKTESYLSGWQEEHPELQLQIDRFTSAEELLEGRGILSGFAAVRYLYAGKIGH